MTEQVLNPPDPDPGSEENDAAQLDEIADVEAPLELPPPPSPAPRLPVATFEGPDRLYQFADRVGTDAAAPPVQKRFEIWVTFLLAGVSFGLPVTHVQEILRVESITRVPHAPASIRGVTNMRGRVLPVVDLRVRLALPEAPTDTDSRLVVASSRGRSLALLVDTVTQVLRIDTAEIQPPPPDVMTEDSDYIVGVHQVGDRPVVLLDVDRVLVVKDRGQARTDPKETRR